MQDIISLIEELRDNFTNECAKVPSCLYLGTKEQWLLAEALTDLGYPSVKAAYTDLKSINPRPKFNSMEIYLVNASSHLAVSL